jgi:hypothetical protein
LQWSDIFYGEPVFSLHPGSKKMIKEPNNKTTYLPDLPKRTGQQTGHRTAENNPANGAGGQKD